MSIDAVADDIAPAVRTITNSVPNWTINHVLEHPSLILRVFICFKCILVSFYLDRMRFPLVAFFTLAVAVSAQTYPDFPSCSQQCLRNKSLIYSDEMYGRPPVPRYVDTNMLL